MSPTTRPHRRRRTPPVGLLALAAAPACAVLALTISGQPEFTATASQPAPVAERARVAPAPEQPSRPATARRAPRAFTALDPPLIGASRAELIATLGRPASRGTEGGAGMELLEYRVSEREYQVVVLRNRVVEINRFR